MTGLSDMLARLNPRDVADAIGKTAQHLSVEEQLRTLMGEHAQLRARQLALIHDEKRENFGTEINRLASEMDALNSRMNPLRGELQTLRAAHGAEIAQALEPLRREAAQSILDLLVGLRRARDVIDRSQGLIESAGGSVPRMPPIGLAQIELHARKILGVKA